MRYKIDLLEIDVDTTEKYISENLPIEVLNSYYGYKPMIKSPVGELTAEIKLKDTVTRRLKITLKDELDFISAGALPMASYWGMWLARNLNYKGKLIRYYRQIGSGEIDLKFSGKIENITVDALGNITIEAVDLLKSMSKVEYPFLSGIFLAEDLPALFTISVIDELIGLSDAVSGDYARHPGFFIFASTTLIGGTIPSGTYYFKIAAYISGVPVALSNTVSITITLGQQIILTWVNVLGADEYRIFGTDINLSNQIYRPPSITHILSNFDDFIDPSDIPEDITENYFYYRLKDAGFYYNFDDWELIEPLEITVDIEGSVLLLGSSGYLKIEDELIFYEAILTDSEGYSLYNLQRGLFNTEPQRHASGTAFYYIFFVNEPINIFLQLKAILNLVGLDDSYISSAFDDLASDPESLMVTTLPIIEETKLSEIYFDLVNLADCLSFQNEEGQIDIIKNYKQQTIPDDADLIELTDESNLIYKTAIRDLNEKSRFTQWILYYKRVDLNKKLDDPSAYYRGNITIDDDAETYYGDVIRDKQFSAWLNPETEADVSEANIYVNELLNSRRIRQRDAQNKLAFELEIKDDNIKLGQTIKIQTSKVINELGISESLHYRIMKKEPGFNKIKFTGERLFLPFTPTNIENLYVWFPDFNLETSDPNFTWLDEVSKTIQITGNYGTGNGIIQVNNKNVLHTIGGTVGAINSGFMNKDEFTFIGALQKDFDSSTDGYICQLFTRNTGDDNFAWGHHSSGGAGSKGLRYRVFTNGILRYSLGVEGLLLESSIPFIPTIFAVRFRFDTAVDTIKVTLGGSTFTDDGIAVNKGEYNDYKLTFGSDDWRGNIFEFMYYDRFLSDDEINLLGNYMAQKYNIAWVDI